MTATKGTANEIPTRDQRNRLPVSTYRLQFHGGFGFPQARAIVPYLSALGISDCYASPVLAARPGSTHGYDICDHSRLNPELGGEEGFVALTDSLAEHGMGLILDYVPNHMGVDPIENKWWRDVLENGPSSPYARYFDIDWDPILPELKGKVLLPILGDQYGKVLEDGHLQLALKEGSLCLKYFEHNLPMNPRQARVVFEENIEALEVDLGVENPELREFLSILTALRNLPAYTETDLDRIAERHREKEVARERLGRLLELSPRIRQHVEENIKRFNGEPGNAKSFDRLHELLENQAYRLAFWRVAGHEINYRRFFDINELAGLSTDVPEVFDEMHALVLEYVRQGRITGLRLDHVDGLLDPAEYFNRLQHAITKAAVKDESTAVGAATAQQTELLRSGQTAGAIERRGNFYVVAEKILSGSETMREDWAVDGTTGYDFLNDVNGLFVQANNAQKIKKAYGRFTGSMDLPADIVYESKKLVMATSLASELNVLAYELHRISEVNRRSRDFTLDSLRDVLREIVAVFPVYRTYLSAAGWVEYDAKIIETAVTRARRRNPSIESSIFDFVWEVLLPRRANTGSEAELQRRLRFARKLQQFTAPVQAKGLEDTTFYRYVPLVSLNEVEGDVFRFGRSVLEFHEANLHRGAQWPFSMLATATHDTKRGEDARARLNVLSEIPEEWRKAVSRWARLNAVNRTSVEGEPAPDRNDEYLFYQALLGAWPAEPIEEAPEQLVERLQQYMIKAVREAKVHTSWISPFEAYEQAVLRFVERSLRGSGSARFLAAFRPLERRVSRLGMVNSLAQVVLKLTSPGVPDSYQGSELWDFNLVDPDNRRPVDFEQRRRMLEAIRPMVDETLAMLEAETGATSPPANQPGRQALLEEVLAGWPDGRVKMLVTATGLRLRRVCPELFLRGEYIPLEVHGEKQQHVVAFARRGGQNTAVVIVPRLIATLPGPEGWLPMGGQVWGETQVGLADDFPDREYLNLFTGEALRTERVDGGQRLVLADALRVFPVGLFCARLAPA